MTREERHIAVLNRMLENMNVFDSIKPTEERKRAIKEAIKALEQEPSKREIEREYLFQSLCEDFKTLQAENDDLRKRLEQEPCEDAISRKAVLDMATTIQTDDFSGNEIIEVVDVDDVKALPSVKPQEPKTGYWIRTTDKAGHLVWECGKCGWQQRFNTKFCPDCGAKMIESQESEEM